MNKKEFVWNLGYYFYEGDELSPDIKGYERHFIRGLVDASGKFSVRKRTPNSYPSFQISILNQRKDIVRWAADTISSSLFLDEKTILFVSRFRSWKASWEGNIARLVAWWLYHGDIETCCNKNKFEKYQDNVLDNNTFESLDDEILYTARGEINGDAIKFNLPSRLTLPWCKRVQKLLSYNTVPVFHNKGKRKYYELYIPRSTNMRDASDSDVKA